MENAEVNILFPLKSDIDGYRVIFGKTVTHDNIKSAVSLDYISYDDIYHLEAEDCFAFHNKNPFIYIMVLDMSSNVVGYINYSPVTDNMYEQIKSGEVVDTVITADDILSYKCGGEYSIYFSSICVHPNHRGMGIAKILLKNLDALEKELQAMNIRINRIVADAVSESGIKILEQRGFEFIQSTKHNTRIMERLFHA